MWVWRGLGYDNVIELPSGALGALGCRCRPRAAALKTLEWTGVAPSSTDAPSDSLVLLNDEQGDALELYPHAPSPASSLASSTYRLAPLEKLRLCIPGAVELLRPPPPTALGEGGGTYGSLLQAISQLVASGGGALKWQVPMVDARLRPDVADECCHTPAPPGWPLCVVGAVFGASLDIAVTAPWPPTGSPSKTGNWAPPPDLGPLREVPPVPCDGFQIQILQQGGPPLDPRRLNKCSEEGVAEELGRWVSKCLAARPETWYTLYVTTQEGEVQASLGAPLPAPLALAARRQTGDMIVAVAADTELALEPFELSYGDAHISSLRRMVEDEVAHVLGIPSERVLCGEFLPSSSSRTKRRHVRQDTIGLRFALLHHELVDLIQPKELPRRPVPTTGGLPRPRGWLDKTNLSETLDLTNLDKSVMLDATKSSTVKMGPTAQLGTGTFGGKDKESPSTLKAAGLAMTQLMAMAHTKNNGVKTKWDRSATMTTSTSLPNLVALPAPAPTASPVASSAGQDLPPDLLLKRLVSALAEGKHPLRKHPDVFPMLARVVAPIRTTAMLVVDRHLAAPGRMAEGLRSLMKGRANLQRDPGMDPETRMKLSTMRSEILRVYAEPAGDVMAQTRQLTGMSAKELLEEMEGAVGRPTDLQAALQMLIEHTETDVEWCLRLRSHKAVERVLALARRFNSEKGVVGRAVCVLANLTNNDVGCTDRMLEKHLAPDFIQALENFPQDRQIQFSGCQVLRRLYIRAREQASHGPRVVCLGKSLAEVWTFKGLERVLTTMRLFGDAAEIQVECFTLLASLAELLYNNGMAVETFNIMEVVMRKHSARPDILAKGVLIIARLGPIFLSHDPRGVYQIVQAMARHRSDPELQRVGTRALVAMAREEKALHTCRSGGGVGATVAAMAAHSKDEQVLREGMIALEKHCPRGLSKAIRICGDIAMVLPHVSWTELGRDSQWEPALLDGEWDPSLVKMFREDMLAKPHRVGERSPAVEAEEEELEAKEKEAKEAGSGAGLATLAGYRRYGLREEFDAADTVWATSPASKLRSEARERDIRVLKQQGCDAESLRPPGPSSEQLKRLCEALRDGLGQNYSAQDGELLASMIGHFAWCSPNAAREVMAYGGAQALVAWLTSPRFSKGQAPEELALAYPMQRVCLGALSGVCLHDEELQGQILALGVANVALDYAEHVDQRMQRSAMRLLARLIPTSGPARPPREHTNDEHMRRALAKTGREVIARDVAWRLILRQLRHTDEIARTCAAACALEAVEDGWATEEGTPLAAFAEAVLHALERAVRTGSSAAGLPLLMTVCHMLTDPEDEYTAARALLRSQSQGQALVQLLAFWLPKGISAGAMAADRGAAISAASALQSLSEFEAPLPFREMRELMVCGQSTNAEPVFRDACKGALLLSVDRENQPQQLAHLFATRVGKGRDSEERLADIRILRSIAQRIVTLLRLNPAQATDALVAALSKAEPLVPKEPKGEAIAVKTLLAEVHSIGARVALAAMEALRLQELAHAPPSTAQPNLSVAEDRMWSAPFGETMPATLVGMAPAKRPSYGFTRSRTSPVDLITA